MRLIGHSCERQTSNLAGETSKSGQVLVRTVENKTEFIDHLSEGYVRALTLEIHPPQKLGAFSCGSFDDLKSPLADFHLRLDSTLPAGDGPSLREG